MLPILFQSDWIIIFSYPLFMGLAWGLGYQLTLKLLQNNNVQTNNFKIIYWGVFLSSWIGSKVFYLISSSQGELTKIAINSNFWFGGGLVFYGGLIFGVIYILTFCLIFKKFSLTDAYLFLPPVAISHGVGRIGCFLAGCCYGVQCDLPWGIHLHGAFRHPVQLYEAIILIIFGIFLYKKINKTLRPKQVVLYYFVFYALIRFVLEFFRGDKIRGLYFGLSTSQLVSIAVIILAIIFVPKISEKN